MKKIAAIIFLILIISGVYGYRRLQTANWSYKDFSATSLHTSLKKIPDSTHTYLTIGDDVLRVEVVHTPESITRGLSGRPEIGADGMLFVLPQNQVPVFWMKEMQFDLDLVWIAGDSVQKVTPNVPAPDPETALSDLPKYSPSEVADLVLEVPAGVAADLELVPGKKVMLVDESKYQR